MAVFVPIRRFPSLLAIAALVSGCVLFVPSAKVGGEHCGFAGRDTSCGTCVAARCTAAVDACCEDASCGGIIKDLESCSAEQGASCDRLGNATDSEGAHRDLSACVAKECREVCANATPSNLTKCTPAYVASVDACKCSVGAQPNNTACTTVGHPNLRCCAPPGWPGGPALECTCLTIICSAIGGGCQCELTALDDNGRDTECKGGKFCCANASLATCSCGDRACLPQEDVVPACNITRLGCRNGEQPVESCSTSR
jgi:hypothetical protein